MDGLNRVLDRVGGLDLDMDMEEVKVGRHGFVFFFFLNRDWYGAMGWDI